MPSALLNFILLGVTAFGCAAWLEPVFLKTAGPRAQSDNVLAALMGDSRRMFAQHFFAKADAYFHSGYYPSIFDPSTESRELHIAANASADQSDLHECPDFMGASTDWIDRFSRNFYPSEHRHLGECEHDDHDHDQTTHDPDPSAADSSLGKPGDEREMLPWLRIAAELDPQRPQTYVVASFWLRSQLNKVDEAEQFLREGLWHNPGNCEILFELGRIYRENRQDNERARNLWELGLKKWRETESTKTEPNSLLHAQLLGNLARLEEEETHYDQARRYLEELTAFSPNKDRLQKWLGELQAKAAR